MTLSSFRWLAVVLIAGFLVSCNGKDPLQAVLSKPKPKTAEPLWQEPEFAAMMAAFKKTLPAKPRILVFTIDGGSARVQVQDPAKPENVDGYEYRGGELKGPIPVKLMGGGKLEDNLFDWDGVALDHIPELVKTATEKVPLEGGKIVEVHVGRVMRTKIDPKKLGVQITQDVQIRVSLEGTRGFGSLLADEKGNVIEAGPV